MLTLKQIRPHLLYPFPSNLELLKSIEILWSNFTSNREDINEYLDDPKLVSAYTAFYMATNYQKFSNLLSYSKFNLEQLEDYDIYDIGCGPGTFLTSFIDQCLGHKGNLYGIDKSAVMQEQARRLLHGLGYKDVKISQNVELSENTKRAVIFGYSLNEMKGQQALNYIYKIKPEIIIMIEPGTSESFNDLLEVRDSLIGKGYDIQYPCPGKSECPMKGSEDWCHQYISLDVDPELASLAQTLKLDRGILPMCAFIFKKSEPVAKIPSRFVRYYRETKHSFDWQVCESKDDVNVLVDLEVAKRPISKQDIKDYRTHYPGQEVDYEVIKDLPDKKRVKIKL